MEVSGFRIGGQMGFLHNQRERRDIMRAMSIRMFSLLLGIAMILTFGAFPSFAADEGKFKDEGKLTLNVAPSFYWGMGATKFAELVKEKTNGKINVKPYYNSTLLKGAQLQSPQMVAKGIIDCAVESTINSSAF